VVIDVFRYEEKSYEHSSNCAKSLEVIRLVASRGTATVTEIAGALDISPSMAHRLLHTCTQTGYLRQDISGGSYAVGPLLRQLAQDVERDTDLVELLGPTLEMAAKGLLETCSLAVLEGRNIRFIMSIEGTHLVRVARPIRTVTTAHNTAAGRSLLTLLPIREVKTLYRKTKRSHEEHQSIVNLETLFEELERTRERGWAIQAGEAQPGLAAVAMALLNTVNQPVVALTVTVPYLRLHRPTDARFLIERLQPYAEQMQRRLLT